MLNTAAQNGHPVEQALAALEKALPTQTARATQSLASLLKRLQHSNWSAVAWKFSSLTKHGYPVEFTFTSTDQAVRYTTEVAGPEVQNAKRLRMVQRQLRAFGQAVPENLLTQLEALQHNRELSYGAWIGGRHDAASDRYKLYAEVPDPDAAEARALVQGLLGSQPLLANQPCQLRMVGCEPVKQRLELYFRVFQAELYPLGLLLKRVGLQERSAELIAFIQSLTSNALRPEVFSKYGFSYAFDLQGGPVTFSFFLPAHQLFGRDRSILQALCTTAEHMGWDPDLYQRVSAPLLCAEQAYGHHGMLTVGLGQNIPLFLGIGLRPPG